MASSSIDRYRPPVRDGYPPPPLPPTSSAPVRPSRSPPRRPPRDVPPPVPTPPANSARTPPPLSSLPPPPRSSQQQPQPSSSQPQPPHAHAHAHTSHQQSAPRPSSQPHPQSPPRPRPDPWLFTPEEVVSSPSILDGLSLKEQRLRRAKGVNFIYQVGCQLNLPQLTQWVAGAFFHRFYMRYSMVEERGGLHHYNIAATSIFLACKAEENCRKTKNVIIAVAKVAQKNPNLLIDEQSKEYWRWRDSILTYEELMLEYLTFDVSVANPYSIFFDMLGQFGLRDDKELRQAAWAFCNDACLTHMPLIMTPRDIAAAAICFASLYSGRPIPDVRGEPWWRAVGADESRCLAAVGLMSAFYAENPLQKRNPSLASPPFHLDTTRRAAAAPTTAPSHAGSDSLGTPDRERERATQSPPRSIPNGGGGGSHDHDRDDGPSRPRASQSPSKRRTSVADDDDASSDSDERSSKKKARLSEDEGEVVDD